MATYRIDPALTLLDLSFQVEVVDESTQAIVLQREQMAWFDTDAQCHVMKTEASTQQLIG